MKKPNIMQISIHALSFDFMNKESAIRYRDVRQKLYKIFTDQMQNLQKLLTFGKKILFTRYKGYKVSHVL